MTDTSKHTPKCTWTGTSPDGIDYEIQHWGKPYMCDGRGMWNYYVYLHEAQFTPDTWKRIWLKPIKKVRRSSGLIQPIYDDYNSILSAGDFHGGITAYEKILNADSNARSVKVGCDYGHYFDERAGYHYDVEYVRFEALATCKKLASILKPLTRCSYTGQYFDPAFCAEVIGFSAPVSPAGLGAWSHYQYQSIEKSRAALAKAEVKEAV